MSEQSATRALSAWRDPLLINALRPYLGTEGQRRQHIFLFMNAVGGALDGLAVSLLMPLASALAQGNPAIPWITAIGALALIGAIWQYASARFGYAAVIDYLNNSNDRLGRTLARLPMGWFTPARTAVLSRFIARDTVLVAENSAQYTGQIVRNATGLLTIIGGAIVWQPRVGWTLAALAPFIAITLMWSQSLLNRLRRASAASENEVAHRLVEFASCQPMLRAAGRSINYEPLRQAAAENERAQRKELWLSLLPILFNGMVLQSVVVVTIIVITHAHLDPITTVVFIGVLLRYARNLEQLGQLMLNLGVLRKPLQHLGQIVNAPLLSEPTQSAQPVNHTDGHEVALQNVRFGYDPERPVIRDVSFTVAPHTMTAIVGPSGSGKTTIARLIARFWDVNAGEIRVDGVDIRHMRTEDLMARMSMVFQDVYLFDDTLTENIRVARPEATDAEIREVSDLAGVTSIADRLGWDAPVGEGGRRLSGGERQRVSIARALLKNAPIVLFDEATSALDAENEGNVMAAVARLRASSTLIVIAHKLETIEDADQIVVLNQEGRIEEIGTHAQLHAASGTYRRFWDRRRAAHGWQLTSSTNP
ncbi:Iron import ATP-binding/permease protein IrtB [Dermatophilus congolensis]|uniref:Iron import ATP-binding/permease protein IrtB n=1 Tax=Dermatophilus congolensis TaxID=1863 RepID=A0A239VLL0_9MICO|nr:ABC transporter ATP-binding protein [Dermatophilus congolensis]SNV22623.1 Iron import ATP-binding/permease protein IrtB [Dermatophilus congolensis]